MKITEPISKSCQRSELLKVNRLIDDVNLAMSFMLPIHFFSDEMLGQLPTLSDGQRAVLKLQDALDHSKDVHCILELIIRLAEKAENNRVEINSYGGFELVLKVLINSKSSQLCATSIRAIGLIGFKFPSRSRRYTISSHPDLQDRIRRTCEVIMASLNRFPMDENVAIASFFSFWNMAIVCDSDFIADDVGSCEAIVATLIRNIQYEAVVYEGCFAISTIAGWNQAAKSHLGNLGVCDVLVDVAHRHMTSERVLAIFCETVSCLAHQHEANRVRLLASGACESTLQAIHAFPHNEAILWCGCHVLLDLHFISKSQREQLVFRNAISNTGVVFRKPYADIVKLWKLEDVLNDVKLQRRLPFLLTLIRRAGTDIIIISNAGSEKKSTDTMECTSHSKSELAAIEKSFNNDHIRSTITSFI
eukprot:gene2203-4288_t